MHDRHGALTYLQGFKHTYKRIRLHDMPNEISSGQSMLPLRLQIPYSYICMIDLGHLPCTRFKHTSLQKDRIK